jgi:hypothetical protein
MGDMPSGTDTIRIMKHTDLPWLQFHLCRCQITKSNGRSLHDWLQLHRLPMLRTSVAMNWRLSGRQYIHDNFQNGAIKQDHTDIAALAMIIRAAPT